MKIPVIVEQRTQGFDVFVPYFPDCTITAATPVAARELARAEIQSRVDRILTEGGELPDGDARVETIEVTLPDSLARERDSYEVIIEKAPGNYAAWVPNLPVCVSVGDTVDEMRSMIKEAIEFHVEALVEDGEQIPPQNSLVEMIEVDVPRADVAEVAN